MVDGPSNHLGAAKAGLPLPPFQEFHFLGSQPKDDPQASETFASTFFLHGHRYIPPCKNRQIKSNVYRTSFIQKKILKLLKSFYFSRD
jgi:hypothetical protein